MEITIEMKPLLKHVNVGTKSTCGQCCEVHCYMYYVTH